MVLGTRSAAKFEQVPRSNTYTFYRATMTLENVLLEPTLDTVKGILILDNDGKRILAKWVVRSYGFHNHI